MGPSRWTPVLGVLLAVVACGGGEDGARAAPHSASGAGIELVGTPGVVDAGYSLGDADAPIAVVEFSDFGCPYCARFSRLTFPVLREAYIETGEVRWRFVPVVFGFAGGDVMGAAAVCVAEHTGPDAFWRIHDALYRSQTALRGDDARSRVLDLVEMFKLDRARVDACMDDSATTRILAENTEAAREWYVRGTPTFVINGVPMSGAMPPEVFARVFATLRDPSGL